MNANLCVQCLTLRRYDFYDNDEIKNDIDDANGTAEKYQCWYVAVGFLPCFYMCGQNKMSRAF